MLTGNHTKRVLIAIPCLLALSACAKSGDASRDTAAAPAATGGANANPIDTGMKAPAHDMAGMNHDTTANRPAPRDSTQRTPSRP